MKLAVLSGKGGAGKTFVSVNLAAVANHATYIDCDVEEPNGHLFFKPENITTITVNRMMPEFDAKKCDGCRKCVDFCHFNALIYLVNRPLIFKEVCHSCGGCMLVCPNDVIHETKHPVGVIEDGWHQDVHVITGILNTGESSGIPVIKEVQKLGSKQDGLVVYDCPPGSACSVMETITDADYCVLVAEPTAFGFHNFCMVYELASLLDKKMGVVINKQETPYQPLEDFCKEHKIPILARIPYDQTMASLAAQGKIVCECNDHVHALFFDLLEKIEGAVK